jgi:NADH dehydrogenase (ubiquinone) 1 beta subcomplex subunit 8
VEDSTAGADSFAQNGGYINPPRIKRQFRDPHADWWDKQERRNFGEPVHEDHDILGMFSTYEYTWITPGKGLAQIGAFIVAFLSVVYVVKLTYPDRVSYPREFEGGLERELGGPGAVRVSPTLGIPPRSKLLNQPYRPGWRAIRTRRAECGNCVYTSNSLSVVNRVPLSGSVERRFSETKVLLTRLPASVASIVW